MKLLSGGIVQEPLMHIAELPDNFVISGVMYTKNPLSPLPLQYTYIPDEQNSVHFKNTYYVNNNRWHYFLNMNNETFQEDSYDNNIVYLFYNSVGVIKLIKNSNGYIVDKVFDLLDSNYSNYEGTLTTFKVEYINQDKDKLYIFKQTINYSYFYSIDKNTSEVNCIYRTFKVSNILDSIFIDGVLYIHYLNTNNSYYSGTSAEYSYLYSLNTSTKATTIIYSWYGRNFSQTIVKKIGNYKLFKTTSYYNYAYRATSSNEGLRYSLDGYTVISNATSDYSDYYFNLFPEKNIMIEGYLYSSEEVSLRKYTYDKNIDFFEEKLILPSSVPNTKCNVTNNDYKNTGAFIVSGSLLNDQYFFAANQNYLAIYQWDTVTKTYVLVNEVHDSIKCIGVDTNENMWVQNADKEIYTVQMYYTDYEIDVTCDTNEIDFVPGEEKQIDISVKASTITEQLVPATITLKINGSARFTSNSQKELIVEIPSKITTIPITVYDTGLITINAV